MHCSIKKNTKKRAGYILQHARLVGYRNSFAIRRKKRKYLTVMIFYKGNGKKECELSKSQLCPARSNRRPLLVRLSLYLPFPAAFPRKFPFSFSFRIFYLRIFCFIHVVFFIPCIFAQFFSSFFANLVFIFCPSVLLSANKCFLFFL